MRIFVDSRFGEGPSNDFRFTLARPVELREGSVGVIDQVILAHTFETVMTGFNDRLYLAWQDGDYTLAPGPVFVPQGPLTCRVLTVAPHSYNINSMASHLQTILRAEADDDNILVMTHLSGTRLLFSQSVGTDKIRDYFILTHEELRHGVGMGADTVWNGPTFDRNDPQDVGLTIGLMKGLNRKLENQGNSILIGDIVSMTCYRQLFLHSHFGTTESIGPRGENTIVKSIAVTGQLGDVILEKNDTNVDAIRLPTSLSQLHFSLRDVFGRLVPTSNQPVALSIYIQEL